jgi:hypothetical protein
MIAVKNMPEFILIERDEKQKPRSLRAREALFIRFIYIWSCMVKGINFVPQLFQVNISNEC